MTLSGDGSSAHVVFEAGTCAYGFEGEARINGDVLEVGIYALADPEERPTPDASGIPVVCAGVGIDRTIDLRLDSPFTGAVVRDLSGQVIWLEAPPWLATLGALPEEWELRDEGNVLGTATPRWERTWSPVHETVRDPDPAHGDSILTLIQSFGGPVSTDGGAEVLTVEVDGRPATLAVDHYAFGTQMLLVWSIADSEFALVGWDFDFTREEFIALAESIVLPLVALPTDAPVDWAELIGHAYVAIDVSEHGQPFALAPETRLRLRFDDAFRLGANAACNGIGGVYEIRDWRLVITNVLTTLIGCPDARARQDGWYYAFLRSGPTISRNATGLVLTSGDTVVTYVDE